MGWTIFVTTSSPVSRLRSSRYRSRWRLPSPPEPLPLVPLIDASGVTALRQLLRRCARGGTRLILSGLREQPRSILLQMGIKPDGTSLQFAGDFAEAMMQAGSTSRSG
jgi:sulfate permease, SulP family